ncbi:MAG TPA: hypothetical protein VMT16_11365 [Thermoanaerobaculia bacterium]|nr:hypothetical protein [Thermoanaerobaculia bacterium]
MHHQLARLAPLGERASGLESLLLGGVERHRRLHALLLQRPAAGAGHQVEHPPRRRGRRLHLAGQTGHPLQSVLRPAAQPPHPTVACLLDAPTALDQAIEQLAGLLLDQRGRAEAGEQQLVGRLGHPCLYSLDGNRPWGHRVLLVRSP